jgi:aminoglycoside N3'-acetyltransferase
VRKTNKDPPTFGINHEFSSKTKKVTLKNAKFVEKKKEVDEVVVERKHTIQSTIVRLMKSRKALEFATLALEVEKMLLKFKPTARVTYALTS